MPNKYLQQYSESYAESIKKKKDEEQKMAELLKQEDHTAAPAISAPETTTVQPVQTETKKTGKQYTDSYRGITGYGSPLWDKGLDIDLNVGDPVTAPKNGTVVFAGPRGGFGNQVVIKTKDGNEVMLSHLSGIDVKVGDQITRNQIVGKGGNSGNVLKSDGTKPTAEELAQGKGSHLDLTVKTRDGFLSAKEAQEYVNKNGYETMAANIAKGRQRGMTDDEIVNALIQKAPEFSSKVASARERYSIDKEIKSDSDLLEFLAKKFSGVDKLPVASNENKNIFKSHGFDEEQVMLMAKEHGVDPSLAKRLFEKGDIDRFKMLIESEQSAQLAKKSSTIPAKAQEVSEEYIVPLVDGLMKGAAFLSDITGATSAVKGAVGATGALVGGLFGGALETIRQAYKASMGDGFSAEEIKKSAIRTGKETGKFGEETGKTAAQTAALGGLGRWANIALTAPVAIKTAYDLDKYKDTGFSPVIEDLAVLGINAAGIKYSKGKIIDPRAKEIIISPAKNIKAIYDDINIKFPGMKDKIALETKEDILRSLTPPTTKNKTLDQRNNWATKMVRTAKDVVSDKESMKFENEYGEEISRLPETIEESADVVSKLRKKTFDEYNKAKIEGGEKGVEIKTDEMIKELLSVAENRVVNVDNPKVASYAREYADRLRGKPFSADEAEELIKAINVRNKAFYEGKHQGDISIVSTDEVIAKFFRSKLDEALEAETGAAFQELKNKYGGLAELENSLVRKLNREKNKLKMGLIDYAAPFTKGELLSGILTANPAAMAKGITGESIRSYIKWKNSPDTQIKNVFSNAQKLVKIDENIAKGIKKQFDNSLEEAEKNQKIIGGTVEKGFYIPAAKTRDEALNIANFAFEAINRGTGMPRDGYDITAWVNKNGKIFDTSLQKGYVKNKENYVSERDMIYFADKLKTRPGMLLQLGEGPMVTPYTPKEPELGVKARPAGLLEAGTTKEPQTPIALPKESVSSAEKRQVENLGKGGYGKVQTELSPSQQARMSKMIDDGINELENKSPKEIMDFTDKYADNLTDEQSAEIAKKYDSALAKEEKAFSDLANKENPINKTGSFDDEQVENQYQNFKKQWDKLIGSWGSKAKEAITTGDDETFKKIAKKYLKLSKGDIDDIFYSQEMHGSEVKDMFIERINSEKKFKEAAKKAKDNKALEGEVIDKKEYGLNDIPLKMNGVGVVYGFEPVEDEKGKITGFKFNPEKALMGAVAGGIVAKGGGKLLPIAYKEVGTLSTKILSKLEGKSTVSKQFISDMTNSGDLKQTERDLIREALKTEGDKVEVTKFADKVKAELLPLKIKSSDIINAKAKDHYSSNYMVDEGEFSSKYEHITLPDEVRGRVATYKENIYESPIETSAGDIHFKYNTKNYFGHTRIEDMADNKTRRVIEVQSDLYQKGGVEPKVKKPIEEELLQKEITKKTQSEFEKRSSEAIKKISQYNDPTAHFRMIREEVKKAAEDGKTKLQFPTGETAMKIEGLNRQDFWRETINGRLQPSQGGRNIQPQELSVGKEIYQHGNNERWIITDLLGDGKFKAVPKELLRDKVTTKDATKINVNGKDFEYNPASTETFDISGKADTNNPIYKFYDKEVRKYLTSKYQAKEITDDKGVKWMQVDLKPEYSKMPVEAFGLGAIGVGLGANELNKKESK